MKISETLKLPDRYQAMIAGSFLIGFIYWVYLLFSSNMVIRFDAANFELLARNIYKEGWGHFFRTGPSNEPIYPFLISLSMKLAEYLPYSYQKIQACFQMLFLFIVQFLSYRLSKRLNINPLMSVLLVLYIGFSPALVNSVFSLWSEIAVIPFALGIVLTSATAWRLICENKIKEALRYALLLGILFIGITLLKALFEFIFFLFILPFIVLAAVFLFKKNYNTFRTAFLFFAVTIAIFQGPLFFYKSVNYNYNGHFVVAGRGPYIIYGNAQKRTEHLTPRAFLAGMAFIPGDGVCEKLFGREECYYWKLMKVDEFGQGKQRELLAAGMPSSEADQMLLRLTKQRIFERPFQYTLLTFLEGLKIFFWESTQIGFVEYPEGLKRLFTFSLFKDSLRFLMSLLSTFSFFAVIRLVWQNRKEIFNAASNEKGHLVLLFFMIVFIFSFTCFYSLFYIHTRYLFPIAPFFLSMIAFVIVQRFQKHRKAA